MRKKPAFLIIGLLLVTTVLVPLLGRVKTKSQTAENSKFHQLNDIVLKYVFAAYTTDYHTFTGTEGSEFLTEEARQAKLAGKEEEVKLVRQEKLSNQVSDVKISNVTINPSTGEGKATVLFTISQFKDGQLQTKAQVHDKFSLKFVQGKWLISDESGQITN